MTHRTEDTTIAHVMETLIENDRVTACVPKHRSSSH